MGSLPNVVKTDALEPNTMKPLPPGATDIYKAGIVKQQNEVALQQSLIGGIKRRRKMRKTRRMKGGTGPVVVVQSAPSYSPNLDATNKLNTDIAKLANENYNNAIFDKTVDGNQAEVAKLSTQQQNVYNGKGGKKWLSKKGGAWPVWGCLSGGKKSRKRKSCRCKKRKHKKTCKLMKRRR